MATSKLRNFQIEDGQIQRNHLEADFLGGTDLDLTGGNGDATLLVPAATLPDQVVNFSQIQAITAGLANGLNLQGDVTVPADISGAATGNAFIDANGGYSKGDLFCIKGNGDLTLSDGSISFNAGDKFYVINDVPSNAAITVADISKQDNTESADILRDADVVDNLTSTDVMAVLSANQGRILDEKIIATVAATLLNTNAIAAINAITPVRGEEHEITAATDTITLDFTPNAGSLVVYRNTARMSNSDWSLAGNVVTISNPDSEAGECFFFDYEHTV